MGRVRIIGWAHDGDTYCIDCVKNDYGHPIFSTDEGPHYCGICGEEF